MECLERPTERAIVEVDERWRMKGSFPDCGHIVRAARESLPLGISCSFWVCKCPLKGGYPPSKADRFCRETKVFESSCGHPVIQYYTIYSDPRFATKFWNWFHKPFLLQETCKHDLNLVPQYTFNHTHGDFDKPASPALLEPS